MKTLVVLGLLFFPAASSLAESVCYGSTANGALENGCKLPSKGRNYSSYTALGGILGRTWVHCKVSEIVEKSFSALHSSNPNWVFVVGESGRARGGEFEPHKTHQNGLSVDFMVPVVDSSGNSVLFPTSITNKFGYDIEFDESGVYDGLSIDFEAMAAHLAAVRIASRNAGIGIWRVIFDPELQPKLKGTQQWSNIKDLKFSERRSWVRHDEHYHIDFEIPCRPLSDWNG